VRKVEPVTGPPFAIVRRGKEAIDQALIGIGAVVIEELSRFFRCRRKPGKIERYSPKERVLRGFRRGLDAFALEAGKNEVVDGVARPGTISDLGQRRTHNGPKRPMRCRTTTGRHRSTGIDPAPDGLDLCRGQRRSGGRHAKARLITADPLEQEAAGAIAGSDDA